MDPMTPATMPDPALTQRREALRRANDKRLAGFAVRRCLAARAITVAEALAHPDAGVLTIESLLSAQYRWGKDRTASFLHDRMLDPRKRVRDLTDRQRSEIGRVLS